MDKTNEKTISKSIRIPESIFRDIEKEAANSNKSFSSVAITRMQDHKNALTPALLAKIQNIANLATEAVNDSSSEKAERTQKEVASLWKYLN